MAECAAIFLPMMDDLQPQVGKFYARGNFSQALQCYRKMPVNEVAKQHIVNCLQKNG